MARSTLFLIVGGTNTVRSDIYCAWIKERHPGAKIVTPTMLNRAVELMDRQRSTYVLSRASTEIDSLSILKNIKARGHRLVVIACGSEAGKSSDYFVNASSATDTNSQPLPLISDLVRLADHAFVLSGDDRGHRPNSPCVCFERGRVVSLGRIVPHRIREDFDRDIAEFLSTRPGAIERSLEEAERIMRSIDDSSSLKTAHSGTFVGAIIGITSLHIVQRIDYTDAWANRGNAVYVAHVKLNIPNQLGIGDYLSITHQADIRATHVTFKTCQQLGPREMNDPLVTISLPSNYARSVRALVAELNRSAQIPGARPQLSGRLLATLVAGADRCMQEESDMVKQRRALSKWVARELGRLASHGDESPFRTRELSSVYSSASASLRRSVSNERSEGQAIIPARSFHQTSLQEV